MISYFRFPRNARVELPLQSVARPARLEQLFADSAHAAGGKMIFKYFSQHRVRKRSADQQLSEFQSAQRRDQCLAADKLARLKLAGGQIHKSQTEGAVQMDNRGQIVIFARFEIFLVQHKPGGDHTYNIAPDNSPGAFGVFHLFADCNLESFFYEPGNIGGRRMVGKPAHRHGILF